MAEFKQGGMYRTVWWVCNIGVKMFLTQELK